MSWSRGYEGRAQGIFLWTTDVLEKSHLTSKIQTLVFQEIVLDNNSYFQIQTFHWFPNLSMQ